MSSDVEPEKRISQDIRPGELASLDWRPEHARQSLDVIYRHVVDNASQAINWYLRARRPKRRWAQMLRVGAIIMVAVAGVLPVLSQIFSAGSSVKIQPAWASVALAIAVALVALDRFFGFSSAWARYMATGQAISAALNQFRLDWQKSSCELPIGWAYSGKCQSTSRSGENARKKDGRPYPIRDLAVGKGVPRDTH